MSAEDVLIVEIGKGPDHAGVHAYMLLNLLYTLSDSADMAASAGVNDLIVRPLAALNGFIALAYRWHLSALQACDAPCSQDTPMELVSSSRCMCTPQGYFERNILQALLAVDKTSSQNFTFPGYVVPGIAASIT